MKNEFERIFSEETKFNEAMEKGEMSWGEAYKPLYDALKAKGSLFEQLYGDYKDSMKFGNAEMNINRSLCQEGDKVAECLKENGITRFTFSSNWNGVIKEAWAFQKAGFKMAGMTEVVVEISSRTNEKKTSPAIIFELA